MTKEALSQARQALSRLREELPALLEVLNRRGPMLKGYLDCKPRSCGKPGCRCAKGQKHAAFVLRIPEGGSSRNRSITEAVYRALEPLAEEYRGFRQAAMAWRRLVREADAAIRQLESGRLLEPEAQLERMKRGK
jgi:hypothetical protein